MIILGIVIGIIIGICIGAWLAQINVLKKDINTELSTSQVEKPINTQIKEPTKEQIENPTGAQIFNKELKIEILQILEQRYATASEIANRLDISTQKATALLRELHKEQRIQRLEIDGKILWGQ